MTKEDLRNFETHGNVWGQQRAIRRKQLTVSAVTSVALGSLSSYYALYPRRNTRLVGLAMFVAGGTAGAVLGNYFGMCIYPSVARNDETTMMRRLWWAKQCAGDAQEVPTFLEGEDTQDSS